MSSRLNIAINPQLKNNASKLYKHMGLTLSTAVKMFLQQSINDHKMPFQPHEAKPIPTKSTKEAIEELKHSKDLKTYRNEKAMWRDILK